MDTLMEIDRKYREKAKIEAEQQKILDQQIEIERQRKANFDGLQDELKAQLSASLLDAGVDDAFADVPRLDFQAILKDLDLQKNKINYKLQKAKILIDVTSTAKALGIQSDKVNSKPLKTKTLKDVAGFAKDLDSQKDKVNSKPQKARTSKAVAGCAQVKNNKIDYNFVVIIGNHIYNDKIDIANLIPEILDILEIKKLLIAGIKNANLKIYMSYDPDGLGLMLEAQLDEPHLFAIFTHLYKKVCYNLALIDDSIEAYTIKMSEPTIIRSIS
jgi:hypothetical protein